MKENPSKMAKEEPRLSGRKETDEKTYGRLQRAVEEGYRRQGVPEELIDQYGLHNAQVEGFAKRFAEEAGFTPKETEIAVLGAILHDVGKGSGDFVDHGEIGGRRAEEILLEEGLSPELIRSVRLAVERHMGQEGYPAEMAKEKYGPDFTYPQPRTKVGELLYLCDILTQITPEGFGKIVWLREHDPRDLSEDEGVAHENGISLLQARHLSALKSAQKAYALILDAPLQPFGGLEGYAQQCWMSLKARHPDLVPYLD
jgi:hypothetical protein